MHWQDMLYDELQFYIESLGFPKFRGKQLFDGIHGQGKSLSEIGNVPKDLKEVLPEEKQVKVREIFSSKLDETKKMLYEMEDGELVEGVFLSYEHGNSLCVSTQVGCRMGCKFCASGKNGIIRNLSPYEMAAQVYETEKGLNKRIKNIILMGSGEPFDNYENVLQFLRLLHEERGKNMSYRNMTISTCGIIPGIDALSEEDIPIHLAISLHQTDQKKREEIMPIGKKYPLPELIESLSRYQRRKKQRITMEYTLIKGENNREENLKDLTKMSEQLLMHVNLIPLNPTDHYQGVRPDKTEVEVFKKQLEKNGVNVTIRRELGSDISASCGQLKVGYENGIKGVTI